MSTTRVFQLKIKGEESKTTRWPKSLSFPSRVAVVDVKIAINARSPMCDASNAYRVHSKHKNIAIFWYARSYKATTARRGNTGLEFKLDVAVFR